MKEQYEKLEELLDYYSDNYNNINSDQEAIKQLLHETQEIFDYLPADALQKISDKFDIKLSALSAFIKLIPQLKGENFKHKLTVCSGPRCGAKGGATILNAVEKELNVKPGKVTKDGTFLLVTQNCLKKCKTSPNIKIDEDIYHNVTVQNIPNIIKKYKK
ncbi:MAG: NAD(P)H-dependent oxidoreductase subunit E [Anaerocolumna aminovalerica]|uniref:NADH-quinone oxidoreductase subunit NuoE family protein n=1 Tax=Anaerocolumna aminovalerica TaxID=1527 RepID=UPI001C0F1FAA|nr:NAD(P)H-dependent oxidoreductase subunit E [Anaerocolumna aminovalerica]MBU5333867.1 NAD(P)H-dependent oxidoreductase subunit E [Anaerocolumna aminovalerica]MDU6263988.1 NAD(P)H-dependent oxidoreductase subunit E [Anaerocolumna aminovalerica]